MNKILFWFTGSVLLIACSFLKSNNTLNKYDIHSSKNSVVQIPKELKEISGMAVAGNKLFAHNDEKGIIYQIDYNSGKILKSFSVGKSVLYSDFEDIAIAGEKFFIVNSGGIILEFKEASNNSSSDYQKYSTGLSTKYNVEGLCYDDETNSLLLACKDFPGKGIKNSRAVYSFSIKDKQLDKKPRFVIPIEKVTSQTNIKNFAPSAIRKNPISKTFFIISANDNAIVEISSTGKILGAEELNKRKHEQPEGLEFLADGTMLISDESKDGKGKLTKYPMEN